MTTPTQAQIEAAVQKERDDIVAVIQSTTWSGWHEIAQMIRNRKSTAAAQVGEPQDWTEKRKAIRQSAIERCAQVAEWDGYATVGRQIAAAIRKLKDEAHTAAQERTERCLWSR